jgi:hypothetical protein
MSLNKRQRYAFPVPCKMCHLRHVYYTKRIASKKMAKRYLSMLVSQHRKTVNLKNCHF